MKFIVAKKPREVGVVYKPYVIQLGFYKNARRNINLNSTFQFIESNTKNSKTLFVQGLIKFGIIKV